MKFCTNCGTRLVLTQVKHDDLIYRCPKCDYIEGDLIATQEHQTFNPSPHRSEAPLNGKQQKKRREHPFFPYEPYPQQLEFMEDVKKVSGVGKVLVAEACNGFGKTICALASILPMGYRIVYATRTHEQVRQVLLEVENINQTSKSQFKAVNLASRQHLCLNERCRSLSALESVEACRLLTEAKKCPYKIEIQIPTSLPLVLSIEALRQQGETKNICPYYLSRKASEDCAVVVAPYQYVFNENIRNRVKLELSNKVLIFDEAHNADQIAQDSLSDTLSERSLNTAKRELESIHVSTEFVDDLTAYLEKNVSENPVIKPSLMLSEDLRQLLGVNDLFHFAETYSDIVDEIRNHKMEQGDNPTCFLNGALNFLKHVDSNPAESFVAVYRKSFLDFNLVEHRCLNPSLAIKPIVEEAYSALIMSGTLSPLELFTEILGIEEAENRTYSAIADPDNVRTIIDSHVTTRFTERGENMTRQYGERISRLIAKIPNGVLIFFPQRKLMLDTLSMWSSMRLMEGSQSQQLLGGKPVFVEGNRASENRRVVEEYKRIARSKRGAVLCGVFRGRNAEGSNFPYEEARGVILVGVPYADYSDPVVQAQIGYYNRKKRGLGNSWYVMDAFRAANQAIGRGIRHRDDWCNFILMDHRYQTHQSFISRWVVANGVQEINN